MHTTIYTYVCIYVYIYIYIAVASHANFVSRGRCRQLRPQLQAIYGQQVWLLVSLVLVVVLVFVLVLGSVLALLYMINGTCRTYVWYFKYQNVYIYIYIYVCMYMGHVCACVCVCHPYNIPYANNLWQNVCCFKALRNAANCGKACAFKRRMAKRMGLAALPQTSRSSRPRPEAGQLICIYIYIYIYGIP